MSVTRTFTVTVSNPGSGNKYYIDGVQQDTLNLAEGGTYKFDVSDSSVGGHPFKFSTTSDGTHSGGSEYTTGVTSSGTAGQTDAYVQIVVAESAPTLYYYCQYHSGMGGQANTVDPDTWGVFSWNDGEWGQQNDNTITLTGLSATSSVGAPIAGAEQGWGRDLWGEEPWGDSFSPVISLTGFGLTSALGSSTVLTEINTGWGSDTWGSENWGQSGIVVELTGVEATTAIGTSAGWGDLAWGSATTGWGSEYFLVPADVMGLTGLSSTSSVGSLTNIIDATFTLSGLGAT